MSTHRNILLMLQKSQTTTFWMFWNPVKNGIDMDKLYSNLNRVLVHDFWTINDMKGSVTPSQDAIKSQSGCWDLFFSYWVCHFFHKYTGYTGKGGGRAQPKLCPLKRLQSHRFWRFCDLKPSRSHQNQQPNQRKEAKKKQNKSYKKTLPYTLLSMEKESPSQPKLRKATSPSL